MTRTFTNKPATRESVPLLIGLAGPSGGGKTYSALRLAVGIQRVCPGDIFLIDTEQRRALHYADRFNFQHVVFDAPFGSLDYLAAMEHCVRQGAKTIIVDSFSHEHEGPGGVLEQHTEEQERLHKNALRYNNKARAESYNFPAWKRPKAARRRMLNTMMQLPCNFVLCFRAKEKAKPAKGELVDMGWMPIGGDEILYEMTARALLPPNADGVPVWRAERPGEKLVFKLPEQFRSVFDMRKPRALDEDHGEAMARWAAGNATSSSSPATQPAPPAFSARLEWPGAEQWAGKPLTAGDADTLASYGAAVEMALADAKGAKAKRIGAHLEEIRAAVTAMQPPPPTAEEAAAAEERMAKP